MPKYAVPEGKVVKGWIVRLEPSPEQAAQFRRDCGARRYAYNWAVTTISESFAAGKTGLARRVAVKRVNHLGKVAV